MLGDGERLFICYDSTEPNTLPQQVSVFSTELNLSQVEIALSF